MAAFANPPILHDLPSLTESENTPLVGRLLRWLVKDLENYSAVRKLWDLLTESESMSKAVWSERESPVDKMRQRIAAEQAAMDARLLDPTVPISDLQDLIDRHERSGVVCKKARYKIERAGELEQMVDKWNHQDPWDPQLLAELERTRRNWLGLFTPAIQEARGWLRAVDARRNGIRAWDDLEERWNTFNTLFPERSTEFAADPDAFDFALNHDS